MYTFLLKGETMRNIILLLSIITHIDVNAMKRLRTSTNNRPIKKIRLEQKTVFFPTDILYEILKACAYNKDKLKTITYNIKAFALIDTASYSVYNNKSVFTELLDIIHKTHHCSHESITRYLCPPVVKTDIESQRQLKLLLLSAKPLNYKEKIEKLLNKGARLDFTYNSEFQSKTPLMFKTSDKIFDLLLQHGSNINETTSQGITALMRATQYPISTKYLCKVIDQEDIKINQTNRRGETALLRCIRNREEQGGYVSTIFALAIKKLLEKGADPLQPDKNGCSPLTRAKRLDKPELRKDWVIQLLKDAIAQKNKLL